MTDAEKYYLRCPCCCSVKIDYQGQEYYGDDEDPEDGYASYKCRDCGYEWTDEED